MPTLYTQAEKNIRKTWVYLIFFLLLIIAVGWVISYFLESPAILYFAAIWSIIMGLGSFWFSDKIVLSLSGAKPIEKKDNPELYRLVENLAITAGLPLPKIYVVRDQQPNAFAAGRDPKHAVVAVTTGLLQTLERSELEGVIAHELAHVGNRDTLLATIVVVLVGMVVMMTDFFFRVSRHQSFSRRNKREGGQIGAVMVLAAFALSIFAPLLATLIRLAISRKREFLADSKGALLTRYPDGLAKALEKISQYPFALKKASNATSHLYIVNPFRGKQGVSWAQRLFSTHPPVEQRINALLGMKV